MPQATDDHPRTGQRITGLRLPDWALTLELAIRAARAFDVQTSLGWDIGFTDAGPVVVEGNWRYGLGALQLGRRQGILNTAWITVFNREGAYRNLSLGFRNRQIGRAHV